MADINEGAVILEPEQKKEAKNPLDSEPQWQKADPGEVTYKDVTETVTVLVKSVVDLTGQTIYYRPKDGISVRNRVKLDKNTLSELLS